MSHISLVIEGNIYYFRMLDISLRISLLNNFFISFKGLTQPLFYNGKLVQLNTKGPPRDTFHLLVQCPYNYLWCSEPLCRASTLITSIKSCCSCFLWISCLYLRRPVPLPQGDRNMHHWALSLTGTIYKSATTQRDLHQSESGSGLSMIVGWAKITRWHCHGNWLLIRTSLFIKNDWLNEWRLIGSNEHSVQLMTSSACHSSVWHNEEDEDE